MNRSFLPFFCYVPFTYQVYVNVYADLIPYFMYYLLFFYYNVLDTLVCAMRDGIYLLYFFFFFSSGLKCGCVD